MPPEYCPHCGAEVPRKAKACPGCGSDATTGWSDHAYADNLGLPDEEFDYDDFVEREFGGTSPKPRRMHWIWWVMAILLALLLVSWSFR